MAISARIDELRKKFDENPRRYFAPLANEYRKAGDLDQAIFICQEYLPQQPGHMSGHIVYGQALFDLSRNEEAKAVFETALSLDPENLIALRHLGDIARKAGDTNSARIWYQRVLEADPRNEEIAQIMISLLAAPAHSPASEPMAETPAAVAETPRSSRAVAAEAPAAPPLEVERSHEAAPLDAATEPPPLPPAVAVARHELLDLDDFSIGGTPMAPVEPNKEAEPTAPAEAAAPAAANSEDEGGFNLGTEEGPFEADPYAIAIAPEPPATPPAISAVANAPAEVEPAPSAEAAAADTPSAPPSAAAVLDGLETFEAGVIPMPSDAVVASAELQTESFFDLSATPLSSPAVSESPSRAQTPVEATAVPEAATKVDDAANDRTAPTQIVEAVTATPPHAAEPVPSVHAAEPEINPVSDAPAEAFVTETMAELYLQQGHVESALEIYRRLVELRPTELPLQARLRALEEHGAVKQQEPVPEAEAAPPAPQYAGPTIREFLIGLIRRRVEEAALPEDIPEPANQMFDTPAAEPSADAPSAETEFAASPTPVSATPVSATPVNATPVSSTPIRATPVSVTPISATPVNVTPVKAPPVGASRLTPAFAGESVSGSIDALFGGADASAADANAAATLAEAFASDAPEPPQLGGVPAHRASDELSLDHVFKARTPPRSADDGFSFDQFFAGDANEGASSPAGDAHSGSAPAEGADDVAQFNAWLNGLKKT